MKYHVVIRVPVDAVDERDGLDSVLDLLSSTLTTHGLKRRQEVRAWLYLQLWRLTVLVRLLLPGRIDEDLGETKVAGSSCYLTTGLLLADLSRCVEC
jgi:hypothetical protein